jgi:SAM-dependent methyltransferase
VGKDWHEWYQQYDDPDSHLSWRLGEVRRQLGADLDARLASGQTAVRLLSLCAGDGRDTIPVLAARPELEVEACLVELDPVLADKARATAAETGVRVDVRTADAGSFASFRDRSTSDVLMLCGIFGNISDADVERCVEASRALVRPGGTVIWTRGSRVGSGDPSDRTGDPAEWVRELFRDAGYEEVAFATPEEASYRVGVCRNAGPLSGWAPRWSFSFAR